MLITAPAPLNLRELQRYVQHVGDRFALDAARLGGARVEDLRGAPLQRERGEEYVVVLVSAAFAEIPWLERVYRAASPWDAEAMGGRADVHCYTPAELERRRITLPAVARIVAAGVDLLADDRELARSH